MSPVHGPPQGACWSSEHMETCSSSRCIHCPSPPVTAFYHNPAPLIEICPSNTQNSLRGCIWEKDLTIFSIYFLNMQQSQDCEGKETEDGNVLLTSTGEIHFRKNLSLHVCVFASFPPGLLTTWMDKQHQLYFNEYTSSVSPPHSISWRYPSRFRPVTISSFIRFEIWKRKKREAVN